MAHDLLSAFIGTLDRHRRNRDGRFQTLEFAGASRQLACVGLARQEVALLKDLVVIGIGVGLTAPTSVGVSGDGDQDRGRALGNENRPRFYRSADYNDVKYLLTKRGCG